MHILLRYRRIKHKKPYMPKKYRSKAYMTLVI